MILVFLHEGLGSVAQWRDTPSLISAEAGVPAFVYDREGYGHAPPTVVPRPLTYMHDEAAKLPTILASANLNARDVILVGHSDGASIALIAAGMGAVKPKGIVVIAPHVFVEDISVASIAKAKVAYETTNLREKLAKYHDDVDGAFWGWNGAWLDPAFRTWNIEEYLPRITCPILVVQGANDEYGTLAQVEAIQDKAGGIVDTEIVPDAGHSPFRDDPDRVHARIAAFVRRHLR